MAPYLFLRVRARMRETLGKTFTMFTMFTLARLDIVKTERPRYIVILEPEPAEVPGDVRLRRFLKSARRWWGLKCVSVAEEKTGTALEMKD